MEPSSSERTPPTTREEVRGGILAALDREEQRRGGAAARRLAGAGAAGVTAAVALTLLFSHGSSGREASWHLAACSAVWAGLLVEGFAFVLLRIRTSRVALAPSVALALIGLGLAAAMKVVCPDLQLLSWWASTGAGSRAELLMGAPGSAFCLGISSAALLGGAAWIVLAARGRQLRGAVVPALALSALLLPAIALQTPDIAWNLGLAWAAGSGLGAYLGIAAAIRVARVGAGLPADGL